jgi:restriction system protein
MKLQMHKNSLFAILLRSPWWISIAVSGALFAAARLLLPEIYAFFVALPFAVIGVYAGWRQLRAPSDAAVAQKLESARAMGWEAFAPAIEEAFRREGYAVTRLKAPDADFELTKAGRTTLVACRRWKAMRTGTEPLRELQAAMRKREAHECIYVSAGEISDNARRFSADSNIRLLHGAELARLLR